MRIFLIYTLFIIAGNLCAQKGCRFEYKVSNSDSDSTMRLIVYSKNGNSLNIIKSEKNGRIFYKNARLSKDPGFEYDYMGDGYKKTDVYFKSDVEEFEQYEVSVVGEEQVNGKKCTKLLVKINNNLKEVYLWVTDQNPEFGTCSDAYIFLFSIERLNTALKPLGLKGFPIRIECKTPIMQSYDFVNAEATKVPDSLFDVKVNGEGYSSDYLKRKGQTTDTKYNAMKEAEEAARKAAIENAQKR